jgi:hypothetical protein
MHCLPQRNEIMRTVAEQGVALMVPKGAPDEATQLCHYIQVVFSKFLIMGSLCYV